VLAAALPTFPLADALPPAAIMRLLADSASVSVIRDENTRRYVATASIAPQTFSRLEAMNSRACAATCRSRLLAARQSPDATECARLLVQALAAALELTALSPADAGLPDSLGAAARGTLEQLVVPCPAICCCARAKTWSCGRGCMCRAERTPPGGHTHIAFRRA
jgi:hypothetical protein